jgi:hypothetical protein
MNVYQFSKKKNITFACIVFIAFFCLLEISGRITLAIRYKSPSYVLYGFISKPTFQPIKAQMPYSDYYKGRPSLSKKNPVNSIGLRGPEITPKQDRTLRILCLGASTTYGDNLDYCETYPAILQEMLNRDYGPGRYEVINAGQPGFNLNHIISFVKHEGLTLNPDIVLLLSINNNFKAPGFWFVQIKQTAQSNQKQKDRAQTGNVFFTRIRNALVRYSALGRICDDIRLRAWYKYAGDFNWEGFAKALVSEDNIWETEYRQNLDMLIKLLLNSNQKTKIVLLEQAVNTINFPSLAGPWGKAWQIQRETSVHYPNVYTLDTHNSVINAAGKGVPVWQDTELRDPLHLSKFGNTIMAERILGFLKTISAGE